MSSLGGAGRYSNPFTVFMTDNDTLGQQSIYANRGESTIFVVTFVTLIDRSSGTDDVALMSVSPPGAVFHTGAGGQGTEDRFPLSLELGIVPGAQILVDIRAGTWSAAVTGHYEPLFLAS